MKELTDLERKGLKAAGIVVLAYIAVMLVLTLPANAVLK